jgi:hypothetical protein
VINKVRYNYKNKIKTLPDFLSSATYEEKQIVDYWLTKNT